MFHWICPECGRELASSVKECPSCDPNAAVPEIVSPVAQASRPAQLPTPALTPEVVLSTAPRISPTLHAVSSMVIDAEPELAALTQPPRPPQLPPQRPPAPPPEFEAPEPVSQPATDPETALRFLSKGRSIKVPPVAPGTPSPAHRPARPSATAPPAPVPEPITTAPLLPRNGHLATDPARPVAAPDPLAALMNGLRPTYVWMPTLQDLEPRPVPPSAPHGNGTNPQPVSSPTATLGLLEPKPGTFRGEPRLAQAVDEKDREPRPAPGAGRPLGVQEPEPSTPSFQPSVELRLRRTHLPLAPLARGGNNVIDEIRAAGAAAQPLGAELNPRITLAGPTLPHELMSLTAAGISGIMTERPDAPAGSNRVPGWLVSSLVAATMLVACISLTLYFMPDTPASGATPVAQAPAPSEEPTQAPAPVVHGANPMAKYVEVTGLRFVPGRNRNDEIHYLVVNHSDALLSDINVRVTLRSRTAQPSQPPLAQFNFPMPPLGAYEYKEMVSRIDSTGRPSILPDWKDLNIEVKVGE